MSVSNAWANPFQRSFNQIKNKLIESLTINNPEITDHSEGNIFIIIISMVAAVAEVLHYYIDNMARETFFVTARRYSSLKKHAALVDYRIRSAIPASVDLIVSKSDGSAITSSIEIPVNTRFFDDQNNPWISSKTVTWIRNTYGVSVPIVQMEKVDNVTFGSVTSEDIQLSLGDLGAGNFYADGTLVLTITTDGSSVNWEMVDTFAYSSSTDTHFKVILDDTNNPSVIFGDGQFGSKPPLNGLITGSYYITRGAAGNRAANSITYVPDVISSAEALAVATNPYAASGGSNYEDFTMVKDHVPLSVRTLWVAIIAEDYEDIARLSPGVDKAKTHYICGKFMDVYITPDGGGIASEALLDQTYQNILARKVISSRVTVLPAYTVEINLSANVTGKKSFKRNDINDQIVRAIINSYNYNTSDIGLPVRLSDIYALIDNLPMIDFLTITNLFVTPFPSKLGTTNNDLNITHFSATSVTERIDYIITYNGSYFILTNSNNGGYVTSITQGVLTTLSDGWSITIGPPITNYETNDNWSFTVLPNGQDQDLTDQYVIPVFLSEETIVLEIEETV